MLSSKNMRALRFRTPWAFLLLVAPNAALAGETGAVDLSPRLPFPSSSAGVVHLPTSGLASGDFSVRDTAWFALQPSRIPQIAGGDQKPLDYVLGDELGLAFGVTSRITLAFAQPFVVHQGATAPSPSPTPNSALGDSQFSTLVTLQDNRQGGLGIAGLGDVTLPTGDPTSYAAERGTRLGASICAEYSLLFAAVSARAGYRARTERIGFDPAITDIVIRDEIPLAFSVALRPWFLGEGSERQRLELGVRASLPVSPTAPLGLGSHEASPITPAWLALGHRVELGHDRDVALVTGVEWGFAGSVLAAPLRVLASVVFTPRSHDRDHDGVPDDVDHCPDFPGPKGGPTTGPDAGCPHIVVPRDPGDDGSEKDSDGDGIADDVDQCPQQKGIASAKFEKNGCPP